MNSVKIGVQAVNCVTFVVGLKDFHDDETTVKCMLTKDNKEICYLDFISITLIKEGCKSYNVIDNAPNAKYNIVNPNKTSHSKQDWNNYLNAVLHYSSLDSFIKLLELNTGNKITFVVKRIDYNRFMKF